jgi:hypothetical protein
MTTPFVLRTADVSNEAQQALALNLYHLLLHLLLTRYVKVQSLSFDESRFFYTNE